MDAAQAETQTARPHHRLFTENERREVRKDLTAVFNRVVNHPIKAAFKGLGVGYLIPDAINTVGLIAISPTIIGISALCGLALGAVIAFTVHEEISHQKKKVSTVDLPETGLDADTQLPPKKPPLRQRIVAPYINQK